MGPMLLLDALHFSQNNKGNLMTHKYFFRTAAGLALAVAVVGVAQAATVSSTVTFTQFYDPYASTYNAPFLVNGVLSETPTVAISGDSVTFETGAQAAGLLPNAFSFVGAIEQTVSGTGPDNLFKLGTLTYINGNFHPSAFIDFSVTTSSTEASLDGHNFSGRIAFAVNPNAYRNDPGSIAGSYDEYLDRIAMESADYFTVQDANGQTLSSLGSVRVFDYNLCPSTYGSNPACNAGSVDLYGYINSLHLAQFTGATGGAFVNGSVLPPIMPSVPEPSTLALLSAGLALTGAAQRRRATR